MDTGEQTGSDSATRSAFAEFRKKYPPRPAKEGLVKNADETTQMGPAEGLCVLMDGPVGPDADKPAMAPLISDKSEAHLWVVGTDDVRHALEKCPFGMTLTLRVIKHTNLTGGGLASSGGELLMLDERSIIVNGCSGRYGPRSESEMKDVALAFRRSGYRVWSMGFDSETNRPFPFIGVRPVWVS